MADRQEVYLSNEEVVFWETIIHNVLKPQSGCIMIKPSTTFSPLCPQDKQHKNIIILQVKLEYKLIAC